MFVLIWMAETVKIIKTQKNRFRPDLYLQSLLILSVAIGVFRFPFYVLEETRSNSSLPARRRHDQSLDLKWSCSGRIFYRIRGNL